MVSTGNPHGVAEQPPGPAILAIRCSACNTLYRVSPHEIPETGRRVKCSACGHVWFHEDASGRMPLPHSPLLSDVHFAEPPVTRREGEYASHEHFEEQSEAWDEEEADGDGLTIMIWLIGLLALLVVILGVHVFAPRITDLLPGLEPYLAAYVEVVGSVLLWISETATVVADGLREAFQSYGS